MGSSGTLDCSSTALHRYKHLAVSIPCCHGPHPQGGLRIATPTSLLAALGSLPMGITHYTSVLWTVPGLSSYLRCNSIYKKELHNKYAIAVETFIISLIVSLDKFLILVYTIILLDTTRSPTRPADLVRTL